MISFFPPTNLFPLLIRSAARQAVKINSPSLSFFTLESDITVIHLGAWVEESGRIWGAESIRNDAGEGGVGGGRRGICVRHKQVWN